MQTDPKPIPPYILQGVHIGARVTETGSDIIGTVDVIDRKSPYCLVSYPDGTGKRLRKSDVTLHPSDPLALCHAARWLAERLGMDPGSTAPIWRQGHQMGAHAWFLECPKKNARHPAPGDIMDGRTFVYPMTDPAEALAAACVAVGGAG